MNISGPAAVAKPEMLFYAPGDLTVTFSAGDAPKIPNFTQKTPTEQQKAKNYRC